MPAVTERFTIERRFHGFPGMAHGGYVSGLLGERLGVPASVTLRSPPPLATPMEVSGGEGEPVLLLHDGRVVAKGVPFPGAPDHPEVAELAEAVAASSRFPAARSPSPTCLTCGHQRPVGEGLRILPGPLEDREAVAAPWMPHRAFADGDGTVRPEFVWAALDCPGAWGLRLRYPEGPRRLTVRISARLVAPVVIGEPHVVVGWPLEHRRRLFECGSAIFGPDGDLRAVGHAIWMEAPAMATGA